MCARPYDDDATVAAGYDESMIVDGHCLRQRCTPLGHLACTNCQMPLERTRMALVRIACCSRAKHCCHFDRFHPVRTWSHCEMQMNSVYFAYSMYRIDCDYATICCRWNRIDADPTNKRFEMANLRSYCCLESIAPLVLRIGILIRFAPFTIAIAVKSIYFHFDSFDFVKN